MIAMILLSSWDAGLLASGSHVVLRELLASATAALLSAAVVCCGWMVGMSVIGLLDLTGLCGLLLLAPSFSLSPTRKLDRIGWTI